MFRHSAKLQWSGLFSGAIVEALLQAGFTAS